MTSATAAETSIAFEPVRPAPRRMSRLVALARHKPLGAVSGVLLVLLWLLAAFGPALTAGSLRIPGVPTYDPYTAFVSGATRLEAPSAQHWLGTDALGRDVLSRVVYGARLSMTISAIATALGIAGGMTIGIISGYFMGWFDLIWQRFVDAFQAMPALIVLMVLVYVLNANLVMVMLAISLITIPVGSRLTRSVTIAAREEQYVQAARALGATDTRIVFRHIYPNVIPIVIVVAAVSLGGNLLLEASLAFLGLVNTQTPDWGTMLNGGARQYMQAQIWLAIAPGIAISVAVMGYNLLGDALRDVLDPRLRGTR